MLGHGVIGPVATFGIGLRREHFDALTQPESPADDAPHHAPIDFLEVLTENFMAFGGRSRDVLARVGARYPIVLHGVALSIGSVDPLDLGHLGRVARLAERTRARWWSDHLCFSSAHGVEYHDLVPLPFTDEAVDHVARRIQAAERHVGLAFILENPSAYVQWDTSTMDEPTFVRAVVEAADCGLLLDVNNVWVNATNHGFDARAYIDAMPLERVVQIHMAGHDASGPVVIDTHGAPVSDAVLDLYAYTMARMREVGAAPPATLLEWDHDIPALGEVLAELDKIRARVEVDHAPG